MDIAAKQIIIVPVILRVNFHDHGQRSAPITESWCEIIGPSFRAYSTIPTSYRVRDDAGREFGIMVCNRRFNAGERVRFWHRGWTRHGLPRHPRFNAPVELMSA